MKSFKKEYSSRNDREVKVFFKHSINVYKSLDNVEHCKVPLPLFCKANLIEYEFLDIPLGLNILINKKTVSKAFFIAGKALAAIHSYRDIKLKHGDYSLHNLFFDDECLFVIDSTPPCSVPWKNDMLNGDGREEIIQFVYSSFSSVGFKKSIMWYDRLYNDLLFFLQGYTQKKELPFLKLTDFYIFFKKVFYYRANVGFPKLSSIQHTLFYFLILCFFFIFVRHSKNYAVMSGRN